ncbi:MAG: IS701 family transposase, partial [Planctomycetaceae bacterium]|nr:IS701 family transposase [Planctomycetaceae bacterium]
YKSLKQNASLAKSPARTVTTQSNHLFASLVVYVKLEKLKFAHKLNHFALKAKIYLAAIKAAWNEIEKIKCAIDA